MKTIIWIMIIISVVVASISMFSPNKECRKVEADFESASLEKGKYWIPFSEGEAQWSAQDYTRNPFNFSVYEPLKLEKMAFSLFKNEYGYIRVSNGEGKIGWVYEKNGCTIKIK